jgi:LysR family transcriptional regulator for bpeEF and oprC
MLSEVSDAESALKRHVPRGTIRVDTSATFASNVLIPALADFHRQYPEINIRLGLADRNIDLVQDGVDCVVRIGAPQDSSLVARSIGRVHMTTCAAPSYLDQYGVPQAPDDLVRHRAVNYYSAHTGRLGRFEFDVGGTAVSIPVDGVLAVNDGQVYVTAATEGLGMIQIPRFMVARWIESGALREVLTGYPCPPVPLSLIYPHRRLSARVRIFSEWISEPVQQHADLRF